MLQRAVKRDRAAFAELYDRCIDQVYRHVYYRVASRDEAEDITQETFLRAWKAIDKYKRTGAPFVAWLLVIASNLIIDHHRASKTLVPLEEVEISSNTAETDPAAVVEQRFDRSYVRSTILKLKGEKQKVIMMRFIDGFSYEDIARVLNKSEGAVRVIQCRALEDLRHLLARSK